MTTDLLRADCPECGDVRYYDGVGCCAFCGMDLCWVYADRREHVAGPISRVGWWRVVARVAKAYGLVTPALAQICKTKHVGDCLPARINSNAEGAR